MLHKTKAAFRLHTYVTILFSDDVMVLLSEYIQLYNMIETSIMSINTEKQDAELEIWFQIQREWSMKCVKHLLKVMTI